MPVIKRRNGCAESAQLSKIVDKLPFALKKQEKQLPRMLTDYQRRRAELGKLLYRIQVKLVPLNLFSRYLEVRHIPRRTAYDLIDGYLNKQPQNKHKKAQATIHTLDTHSAERYTIVSNQVSAYFTTLKTQPDFSGRLEAFLKDMGKRFGFQVEVRAL